MVTNSYPQNFISRPSVRALEPPYYLTAGLGFRVFWKKRKISAVRQCRRLCILSRISSHSPRALLLPDYLCSEIQAISLAGWKSLLPGAQHLSSDLRFVSQPWPLYLVISPSRRLIQSQNPFSGLPPLRCGARPLDFHPDPRCYLPKARGRSLYPSPTTTLH